MIPGPSPPFSEGSNLAQSTGGEISRRLRSALLPQRTATDQIDRPLLPPLSPPTQTLKITEIILDRLERERERGLEKKLKIKKKECYIITYNKKKSTSVPVLQLLWFDTNDTSTSKSLTRKECLFSKTEASLLWMAIVVDDSACHAPFIGLRRVRPMTHPLCLRGDNNAQCDI